MRKLWTLGALVLACALGWRLGHATQAVGAYASQRPVRAAEPSHSGPAERALRKVLLRRAVREVVSPSSEQVDVPFLPFLPSVLEALLIEHRALRPSSLRPSTGGDGAPSVAAVPSAACRSEVVASGEPPSAVAAAGAPDALVVLAELLVDPSCTGRSTPAVR